ncbi:Trypsin [Colwellia chukchiensis]|uniref:Trypsin n=1 Tax=Colwellia chukchiensis TaxID=641665 RepID=A0A1H7G1Y6_9GAMM|nr:trypsin-like serine protease [Colwellia chukchiensis]SEK32121.1 Trypsin [Colwellia chukchiensis]
MKWSFLILLVFSLSSSAIIMRHDVDESKYREFAKNNKSIVTFYGNYKDKEVVEGTGTLIAKDWVITAAHVANYLLVDGKVRFRNSYYQIKKVIKHPQWKDKQFPNDIALIQLQSPILNSETVALYHKKDELNKTLTFIGRGDFGTGEAGIIGADDRLRAAQNVVTATFEQWIRFKFDIDKEALPLEGISGPGDSGGPALIALNNTLYIVGVSSWQNAEATRWQEAKYGVIENYARISYFKKWIEKTMELHLSNTYKPSPR